MSPKAVRTVAALGLSAAVAAAQYAYGSPGAPPGAPGPRLKCVQPYAGRSDFGLTIEGGMPGLGGFVCISVVPGAGSIAGLPVLIEPSLALPPMFFTFAGPPGAAGQGIAELSIPLDGVDTSVAGFRVFGQAAVDDPSLPFPFTVTNGLEMQVTLRPQVFAAASTSGAFAPYQFTDGLDYGVDYPPVADALTSNLVGATYADGGTRMYAAGGSTISVVDLAGPAPVWSTFATVATFLPGDHVGVAFDRTRGILWTVANLAAGTPYELLGYDAVPTSPTYGALVHQSSGFGATVFGANVPVGPWSLSPDGRRVAVVDNNPKTLFLFDVEPGSPNFLANVAQAVVPGTGGLFPNFAGAKFTRDGSEALVIRTPIFGSTEIARYSLTAGDWIDHNPFVPGPQNLGQNAFLPITLPASMTDVSPLPDGSLLVCGSAGLGFTARITVGPPFSPISTIVFAPTATTAATRIAANVEGSTFAVGAIQFGTTPTLFVFDTATFALLASYPIGSGTGFGTAVKALAWR